MGVLVFNYILIKKFNLLNLSPRIQTDYDKLVLCKYNLHIIGFISSFDLVINILWFDGNGMANLYHLII